VEVVRAEAEDALDELAVHVPLLVPEEDFATEAIPAGDGSV